MTRRYGVIFSSGRKRGSEMVILTSDGDSVEKLIAGEPAGSILLNKPDGMECEVYLLTEEFGVTHGIPTISASTAGGITSLADAVRKDGVYDLVPRGRKMATVLGSPMQNM